MPTLAASCADFDGVGLGAGDDTAGTGFVPADDDPAELGAWLGDVDGVCAARVLADLLGCVWPGVLSVKGSGVGPACG
jgi:hypothetical protein